MRTIQSPGVEIREFDLTSRLASFAGTDVFVTGFADKGPTDEVIKPTSLREFEAIYGVPKTAAERYLYYSVDPLIRSGANVYVSRMPYGANNGEGFGSYYGALVYPVVAVTSSGLSATNTLNQESATYVLGRPKAFNLTKSQYLSCLDGSGFTWSAAGLSASNLIDGIGKFGQAGVVVLNKGQTTVNTRFEGYYVGLADNTNFNPATQYDAIRSVNVLTLSAPSTGLNLTATLPSSRINFALSGSNTSSGTVSEVIEGLAGFDISSDNFSDILNVGVFKLRPSIFTPDTIKLDYVLEDAAAGSISFGRQIGDPNGGSPLPFFIEDRLNPNSRNVTLLVNDFINNRATGNTDGLDSDGFPRKKIRVLTNTLIETLNASTSASYGISPTIVNAITGVGYADNLNPIGAYSDETFATKDIGSIPQKLDRILDLVRNDEIYNIDVSVEAGLGTIYATCLALGTSTFDDTATGNGLATGLNALQTTGAYSAPGDDTKDLRGNYNTVFSKFQTFAELERKDHIFIADPLRHIFITGLNNKTIKDPNKNWSQHIFSALRHQFSLANTSYATTYANWARVNDKFSGRDFWAPFSGIAAAIMTTTDTNNDPWWAPAGFTRGRVFGVNDIAIEPNQKQRDDLYKFSLNPITAFREGITVFGQKTLQKMPSAFDRINVRRLFLYLEKVTKATCRYYVFEPNTLFTRTRVKDDLRPVFERAKNNEGVYDYIIVCDERNNTPDVIDQNELIIDIYIKPVRSAEFILCNFYATRTGADFQELIG